MTGFCASYYCNSLFLVEWTLFFTASRVPRPRLSPKKKFHFFFILIHPVVFAVTELQTRYTVRLSTVILMLYNSVQRVSVHQNHLAHLLQKFEKHAYVCNMHILR